MNNRKKLYNSRVFERMLEILPGFFVWASLLLPIILSLFVPFYVAAFIIIFDLLWTMRWLSLSYYLIKGYRELRIIGKINWLNELAATENPSVRTQQIEERYKALKQKHGFWFRIPILAAFSRKGRRFRDEKYQTEREGLEFGFVEHHPSIVKDWREIYHMVILATFKESLEILEPSTAAVAKANYPKDKIVFVLAGEDRDAENLIKNGNYLKEKYGENFAEFIISVHPDNPDEGRVKGSGISYAAITAKKNFFDAKGIDPSNVVVTSLDADTVITPELMPYLTYKYIINPNRKFRSYQPIPFFYNNIWDAPAPMRIISTGNSFWQLVESMRPQRLRNFSSHSQSLDALAEVDYWDRFSINDDSRQFWRTYFAFEGNHKVVPLFMPVYNDAVLAESYVKTFRNQYLQLRRWAYGISEFPYIVRHYLVTKKIKLGEKFGKTLRLLEGHFSWAVAPIFMSTVAWMPIFLNTSFKNNVLAHKLPIMTSWILTIGMTGLCVTIWLSLLLLPERPKKYGPLKTLGMIFQWVLLPATTLFLSSIPAIEAQTRLMLGKYLGFYVTIKARKSKLVGEQVSGKIP